jgi:hypothetical protein
MSAFSAGVDSEIDRRISKPDGSLPGFYYQDGYALWVTDLGNRGVKIELAHTQDNGGAIILPPKKAGECGVWMLQTLGQDPNGLPQDLPDILERIARLKASNTIFRRGDKTKIVEALKTLRRRDRELQIKEKLIRSHLQHAD